MSLRPVLTRCILTITDSKDEAGHIMDEAWPGLLMGLAAMTAADRDALPERADCLGEAARIAAGVYSNKDAPDVLSALESRIKPRTRMGWPRPASG